MNQKNKSRNNTKAGTKTANNKSKKSRGAQPQKKTYNNGTGQQKAAASAYATGQVGKAPVISMSRDSCRVIHRELISSVTGSVAFTVANAFELNPGLAATFPWLSVMAQCWEQYRFRKLRFCYYTRTGTNVPGSFMMAPDYDSADGNPASEQIASSYVDVAEDAPWKDIVCNLPSGRTNASYPRHYTRGGVLAANQDVKTYDVGKLFVCTVDGTAVSWGKLWVEYDVEFFLPQLPPAGSEPFGGSIVGATSQTGANPFGTAPAVDAQARGITMSAASVLTFTALGDFNVSCSYTGTTISAVASPTLGAGVTLLLHAAAFPTAATSAVQQFVIRVTSLVGATAAFSLTAATITGAVMSVGQAPDNALA